MQLSRFSDLGLRAMMLLAAADDGRSTTKAIAAAAQASEHHIAKAITRLSALGCVSSLRGRGGGLRITDTGRDMRVGELIRLLEHDRPVVECGGDKPCPLVPACRLRRALADAQASFYRELDQYTVADLAGPTLLPLTGLRTAVG
ncbi:Rrf2 family transcriptional regulator [Gordonia sp. CPCC 205333]|uniref:Rrf2 family transcriptional regulator n=1 Tax=Gordonia sp. CPCC 205333 TaxID=3140790 RepID=UPI003AF38E77